MNNAQIAARERSSSWSTGEHLKRKRDIAKEESELKAVGDIFGKSKRTVRSPVKGNKDSEAVKQENKEEMEELMKLMTSLQKTVEKGFQDNKMEIQKLREEIKEKEEQWQKEREDIQQGVKTLENKINQLEEKMEAKERKERKQNIVIKGLKLEKNDLARNVEKFIKNELEIECKITA